MFDFVVSAFCVSVKKKNQITSFAAIPQNTVIMTFQVCAKTQLTQSALRDVTRGIIISPTLVRIRPAR